MGNYNNPLNAQSFDEQNIMIPIHNAKKMAEMMDGQIEMALSKVMVEGEGLVYKLMVNGQESGTINIPKDQYLDTVSFDNDTQELIFTFAVNDQKEDVAVYVGDLVKEYTAGNGVAIENNQVSIMLDATTEPYIELGDNGIKLVNLDETFATKESIPSLDGYATVDMMNDSDDALKNGMAVQTMSMEILLARVAQLEEKVANASKTNVVVATKVDGEPLVLTDATADVKLASSTNENVTITGKTVTLEGVSVGNNARLKLNGDVTFNEVVFEGEYPKANGNAMASVNDAADVVVKNTTVNPTTSYNGLEIGLNSEVLPKSVLIENCHFDGTFANNSILVFGTQDKAVININNCTFGNVSNAVRLSNKSNVSCTLNIVSCDFASFDKNLDYTGMVLCEDYTSKTKDEAVANNLFGDNKITINLINCSLGGKKITKPEDIATVCGSKDANQLLYVYYDKGGLIPYDTNKYPVLNII